MFGMVILSEIDPVGDLGFAVDLLFYHSVIIVAEYEYGVNVTPLIDLLPPLCQ